MAKRKKTRKPNYELKDFINGELEFVRDKCPHLVTVAASLMPFRDAFYRIGVGTSSEGESALLFDIASSHLPSGIDTIAIVDECEVVIQQCVSEDDEEDGGEVLAEYRCGLRSFWEFLRTIPRSLSAFANYVPSGEPCRQGGDVCDG